MKRIFAVLLALLLMMPLRAAAAEQTRYVSALLEAQTGMLLGGSDADVHPGQHASVYIKSIVPERMKIKLAIVDVFDEISPPLPMRYFFTGDHMDEWVYTPPQAKRRIASQFAVRS